MELKLNVATITAREMSGVLALFATVCPDALEHAINSLSDGSTITDAARVFASAPMPELPGHDGEEVTETTTAAAPPPPAPAVLFAGLMGKVTQAQTVGKISAEEVTACLGGLGLTQLRDLLTRPDLIPAFEATVDAMIG